MKHLLTTHSVIAFLFLITIFNSACKKSSPPPAVLPAITQEGKNTVGFTINGEVWIPYAKCGFGNNPCGEISARYSSPLAPPDGIDFQFARTNGNKRSSLTISSSGFGETITTIGEKIDSVGISFDSEESTGNDGYYLGSRPGSSFFVTKIDHQNQIISGTFDLILLEQNGSGNEIRLQDGRFDFRFNACKCSN